VAYGTGERLQTLGTAPRRVACGAAFLFDVWLPDPENGALLRLGSG